MPPKRPPRVPTPREIRRAFGPDALQAINSHADAIEGLNQQVESLTAEVKGLRELRSLDLNDAVHLTAAFARQTRQIDALKDVVNRRTFSERLHWLFTGQ